MERRNFVKFIGVNALGTFLYPSTLHSMENSKQTALTVKDINNYLRSLYNVGENSVDRIIIGDPDAEVKKIGTCWMPYWETLKEAVSAGVNTMIVHEPTFYTHHDLRNIEDALKRYPEAARKLYSGQIEKKKEWIENNNFSIIRCHDVLDIIQEYGIPFAFGKALGFSNDDIISSKPYYNVYRIEKATAGDVARQIASKLSAFDQPGVAFYGDETRIINTVGLGTGAICDPINFMDIEADLRIAIDDSVKTWTQTYYAIDTGNPLIIVNHGTTEENGMKLLNSHLKEIFPAKDVIHFNQGCTYKWISNR